MITCLAYHNLLALSRFTPQQLIEAFELKEDDYSKFDVEIVKNDLFNFNYLIILIKAKEKLFYCCSFNDKEIGLVLDFIVPFNPDKVDRVFDILINLYPKEDINILKISQEFTSFKELNIINKHILNNYLVQSLENRKNNGKLI